jgi:hypothetical protein
MPVRLRLPGFALALALAGMPAASAQEAAARPEDVGTIDGVVRAFYEVISGPAGQPRQWDRDRTLYLPGMRFVALREEGGAVVADVMDHDAFVSATDSFMVSEGFFEREIGRTEQRFGNFAHVLSAYEWRTVEDGPVGGRGVNSLQLYWDGARWWIVSAVWDEERPNAPIPPELLR